jgi:thioredoxin-related protein
MYRYLCLLLTLPGISSALAQEKPPVSPPPANPALKKSVTAAGQTWTGDLASAAEEARKTGKRVFIDFTGETCTNCKINEKNVFPKPEVREALAGYVRVQLYTDTIPEEFYTRAPAEEKRESEAEVNRKFQKTALGTEQLPLYVVLKPLSDGKLAIVGIYEEGKINDVAKFVKFLQSNQK